MALSPAVSPLKVEIIDSGLIETIIFFFSHPVRFFTTPEILQNPNAKVSRGGIYKTKVQTEILQNSQELEFIKQSVQAEQFQKHQEVEFIKLSIQEEILQKSQVVEFMKPSIQAEI